MEKLQNMVYKKVVLQEVDASLTAAESLRKKIIISM